MILILDLNYRKDSLYYSEYVEPVVKIAEQAGECKVAYYKEVTSEQLENAEKVILCGVSVKDNEFAQNLDYFKWLENYEKPVFGICAGMQVIATFNGCERVKAPEAGLVKIRLKKENPLFSNDFEGYAIHNYAVIPNGHLDVLGESDACAHILKLKGKQHYGALFHPEVRNPSILLNFLKA
ncbi:MAG: hypothetical protein ABIF92_01940 [archaeon]